MAKILVLHGPNLNLLGMREPQLYGATTLEELNQSLTQQAQAAGHVLLCYQSNAEHELIAMIHRAATDGVAFILINPAAFTHTSIALRDALLAVAIPLIEVHLSNIFAREIFRHHSYISGIAQGVITGFGPMSYELALQRAIKYLEP